MIEFPHKMGRRLTGVVPALAMAGCEAISGVNDLHVGAAGAGGAANSIGAGGAADAATLGAGEAGGTGGTDSGAGGGPSSGGDGGSLAGSAGGGGTASTGGAAGEPCSPNGAYACAGHASRGRLVCTAGKWAPNGSCAADERCDSRPGANAGFCGPVVTGCATLAPQDTICQGLVRAMCGPDLLTTSVLETCQGGCVSGACGACKPGTKSCTVGGLQTCTPSGTWGTAAPCAASGPVCEGGACMMPPSCIGLATTCGPTNDSCCTSLFVPGGTFNRGSAGNPPSPATVSDFEFDKYEVTVGRFRKFVAAYPASAPVAGAGAHPKIAGSGWNASWNSSLPADQAALIAAVTCDATYQTWTDAAGSNESKPINCVDWSTAFAFCSWDGGRLPTVAEGMYASAGGSEQRRYPWGAAVPGNNVTLAIHGCFYSGTGTCSGTQNIAPVGSVASGTGKWGHADLAGNVFERNLDFTNADFVTPCNDCTDLMPSAYRAMHGGDFTDQIGADTLETVSFVGDPIADRTYIAGIRCARTL